MCGRAVRTSPADVLCQLFDLRELPPELPVRYNLAPTQPIPVIREAGKLELLRWGLAMKNPKAGGFNARAESLGSRTYSGARRCLVVVDGFYEWRKSGGRRQPFVVQRADGAPMALAGLSDTTGACAIVTAPARGVVASIHDRMPIVLEHDDWAAWLDPTRDVRPILASASADRLAMHAVSPRVGNVHNDDAGLLVPVPDGVSEAPRSLGLF